MEWAGAIQRDLNMLRIVHEDIKDEEISRSEICKRRVKKPRKTTRTNWAEESKEVHIKRTKEIWAQRNANKRIYVLCVVLHRPIRN